MSSLFNKNLPLDSESSEDFLELLPLADIFQDKNIKFEKSPVEETESFDNILLESEKFSPLEALKQEMLDNAQAENSTVVTEQEPSLNISTKSSLLEKCLPFIYDEDGEICIDDKPDYTLESVDDIINSAEKRAKEKIAKLYNLNYDQKKEEFVEPVKPEVTVSSSDTGDKNSKFNTKPVDLPSDIELPTKADVLLDDLNGKRTEVTATESITTTYSNLSNIQNSKTFAEEKTQILPEIKIKETAPEDFEDIMSHTRHVNIKDIPNIKKETPTEKPRKEKEIHFDYNVEDYLSFSDAKKIGTKLKRKRRSAFLRFSFTTLITVVVSILSLPFFDLFLTDSALTMSIIALGLFTFTFVLNLDVFVSFKNAFTNKMSADFITALCLCATELHLIVGLLSGGYYFKTILPALVSLAFGGYVKYRKATMVVNNFKLVAARREKQVVSLIDDTNVTSLMARSSIEGDVLAAGIKRTAEITDFLKNTSYDNYLGSHYSVLSSVIMGISFVVSLFIGVFYNSFDYAICGLALTLGLFAMPSLMAYEYLPITNMCGKLFKMNAAVMGKYSASKIEEINAAVVSSNELFPKGTIELANMHPLGASNIDEILKEATAVATVIKSPLEFVLRGIVGENTEIPVADSVKYEENLGISGWVGDHNFHIGNRTLMEAHSIRVPSLEVDKKILHQGFFPVYIACDQRACALLIIKYKPDEHIENNLLKLVNTGVTLLVNNCDPNITEEMLADYYSIYPDSIKIMDHIGCAKYKNAVNYSETASAHAFTSGGLNSFLAILTNSIKLRRVSATMLTIYIITAILSVAVFTVVSLNGVSSLMGVGVCLLIEAISLIISLLGYWFAS